MVVPKADDFRQGRAVERYEDVLEHERASHKGLVQQVQVEQDDEGRHHDG